MNKAPKSLRLQIGLFGRMNVGKSTFLNYISLQDVAITSPIAGTTTDVVEKTMELLPLGPVVFLDTAGIDDASALSEQRLKKTYAVFKRADIVVLIVEAGIWQDYESLIAQKAKEENIPLLVVINKADINTPSTEYLRQLKGFSEHILICSSIDQNNQEQVINSFKNLLIDVCPDDFLKPADLISDLIPASGIAVLIVPIDLQAPKGRLILPQVQTIREILDNDAISIVVKEREYAHVLASMLRKPDIVICDSQVVLKMVADTPADVKCTTFSILFSRFKGNLIKAAQAAAIIDTLKSGDKILIAESCSHHPIEDDIGRVKIPRWFRQYTGAELIFDTCCGSDYPENLKDYKLIIHCGGCMVNRRAMLSRIALAEQAGVGISNYGVCIAKLQGVIERVLSPFPAALDAYKKAKKILDGGNNGIKN
ncbi:MAG: [FeFe] hydrogenase H-cluster maturation GTPase HydF [Candidatus Omnitrophica bacterium]|nr:[FeFe] hydrogenase H-cluster maturation GTPase HydF [Candidatus Omnitrophota bacterium]